jgi:DNA-binding LacI/PurR family transcriptional regulator
MSTQSSHIRYKQLAEELREQMRRGLLRPGDRLPSFAEMRAQGISQNTMEKVHALLEREHLVERRHREGVFVADRTAKKELHNGILGVTGKGFSFKEYSPYWVSVLRGVREAADDAEKQLLLLDFLSNRGWEKADGILICDWSNTITMPLLPPQMPAVSLLVPAPGMPSVYADDYGGGKLATEYLLKRGHRHIAYLHSFDPMVTNRRVAGWRDALVAAGITVNEKWSRLLGTNNDNFDFGARFTDVGRKVMSAWLNDGWDELGCTAIIAQNDETALGIIEALEQSGRRVPDDVAVVGFDGAIGEEYSGRKLTTMEVPLEEIGKTAAKLLVRQLENEDTGGANRVFPIALRAGDTA